jgi:hypothetical protein
MAVQEQVHYKFKVFVGSSVGDLDKQIQAFTSGGQVAPKSIGVEYLESKDRLVLSLGYRDDEAGYATHLLTQSAGTINVESADSLASLSRTLEGVAEKAGAIICHELFVKANGEVHAVFLAQS